MSAAKCNNYAAKPPGEGLDDRIHVRCKSKDKQRWKMQARRERRHWSRWVNETLNRKAEA